MHLRPLRQADIATYADWGADRQLCLHAGWQGLGTTIARLGLAHGFGPLGLEWIDAEAASTNEASIRILQRLGMVETDGSGVDTYLGVPTPTRWFRITRESYLLHNPVPEGK